jgi:hypothetical protein
MEFDVSKVYTSVNADGLKVGSKVICADSMGQLKAKVHEGEGIETLTNVAGDYCLYRFETYDAAYILAYLIEPPEEKKLKVSDLKLGDIVRHKSRNLEYLVTGIDYDEEQVLFNGVWFDDDDGDLGAWWEKVEK